MAEFDKGQFFFDKQALNITGAKGKYLIGLTEANEADDPIVCFVLNTENNFNKYKLKCNEKAQKFLLAPKQFSFLTNHTAIMLSVPRKYSFEEICGKYIEILEAKADENLCRQIKNCIDMDLIEPIFSELIKDCYKNKSKSS